MSRHLRPREYTGDERSRTLQRHGFGMSPAEQRMLEMERLMQARMQRQGNSLATEQRVRVPRNEQRGEKRKGGEEKPGKGEKEEEGKEEGERIGKTGEMGKRRREDVDEDVVM